MMFNSGRPVGMGVATHFSQARLAVATPMPVGKLMMMTQFSTFFRHQIQDTTQAS